MAIGGSETRAVVARKGGDVTRSWRAFDFGTLPSFSRRQVAAWNVLRRAVVGGAGWQTWITEGLTDLFESPAGLEIRLRQKHTMDPQRAEAVLAFTAGEVVLGRDEGCDIRLAPRSVGNRHTRIFTQDGRCYIEDLGSALGTFLNESRLAANQSAPITSGDQFAIFPYSFTVELTERWVRSARFRVLAGPVEQFQRSFSTNQVCFALQIRPVGAVFLLEADRSFLEKLSAQLLAPLCPGLPKRLGLTPADSGFVELLVAAVLERMNRDLQFPLQAEQGGAGIQPAEPGLAFTFAIQVEQTTGTFRLVIPDDAIQSIAKWAAPQPRTTLPNVSWAFPLSAGYVDLTAAEIALIEPSDIVLLSRETALFLPNAPDRGWRLTPQPGNLRQATVDKYFERGCLYQSEDEPETETNGGTAPDLAGLPIRMHAIIGEKEMTLAEANQLVAGAIVELDGTKCDPVRIALNGRIAGTGELVEVDGRLGVRILAWRAP
jgi:type III secretion system YscQ/HrcQ family protein